MLQRTARESILGGMEKSMPPIDGTYFPPSAEVVEDMLIASPTDWTSGQVCPWTLHDGLVALERGGYSLIHQVV